MAISKKTTNILNIRLFNLVLFTIMVTFLSVLTTMVIIKADDDARLPNLVLTYGNKNKTITKDEEILHHYFNDEDLMYILEVTNDTGLEVLVTSDDTVVSAAGNKYIISFIKKTTVINIQIDEEGKNTRLINITIKVDVPFPFGLIKEENKEEITVTNDKKYPWVFDPLETSRIAYKSTNHVIDYEHYEFLEFMINGPGILYFDYKTSLSLGDNFLAIYVNGDLVNETDTDRFSGNKDWQTTYLLLNEGENIINIAYNKAVIDGNSDTVWIANFGFTTGSTSDQLTIGFSIDGSEYGTVSGLELGTNNLDLLTSVNLVATPNSDALFIGWRNDVTNEFISYQRSFDFVAYKNLSIEAVFISKNHVARIGTTTYDSLEGALDEATSGDIVVLMQSVTLTNNLTVPKGVTLLIPYSENDYFGYVEVDYLNEIIKVNPNGTIDGRAELFRTLSVPSNVTLTVEGTLLVNALTGRPAAGSYNQDNAGGYAQINLEGLIEVEDGGLLDVLGFVKGSGRVIAKDGAEVGDLFVVKNWRGGSVALVVFTAGVFPFNQYDCHNIEATLEIRKGASYYGNVKMFALGQFFYTKFYQISAHTEQGRSGLIRLDGDESFVLKEYDVLTKRTTLTISGDATEVGGTLELSGMEQSTNDFLYPIDGHITFVLTNGNFTILNKLKFLPGSRLIVEETATLVIGSPYLFINAEVIFYESFDDAFIGPTQYPSDLEPASFELYGQLEIYGAFATKFEQIGINATIYLSESAVFKVLSKESGPNYAIAQVIEYEAHLILPSIPSPKGLYNMWVFMDDDLENALDDEWFDLGISTNGELVLGHLLFIKAYPDEPEVEIFITKIDNKRVVKLDINNMNEEFLTYSYTWYKDGVKILNENLAYIDISSFGYGTYYCEVTAEFDGMSTFVYSDEISVSTKDINDIEVEVLPIGNVTYNGYFIETKVTINDGDTLLIEGTDYELTYLNNKNAGVATILINGIGQYDGTKTINFVIEKLVVTTNWSNQESFVYNGLNQIENVKATIQGVGSDNTIILNLSKNEFKNVGTYDFVANIDNDNYILTNTSKTYTIAPLVIGVNWSVEDNFVYNGLDQSDSVMASIQGVGNDNMIMLNLSEVAFKNAGSYDFVASLDNDNYTLINTSKSYTIVPLSVEVIWSEPNNFSYNGLDQSDSIVASIQGVGSDNTIMLNLSEVAFKNVGKFEFIASLDNANYTLTNISKSYTIVPLKLDVNWSADDNFVYNGLDQKSNVTAYIEGVGNDDIIEVTLTTPSFINAGKFEFIASLDNANYTLTNTSKSYTIVPFEVEVIWSVDDNFGYNGFDQSDKVSAYINGVSGKVDVTLIAPEFKNVGEYEFVASLDNANYTLTNSSKSYTIVPFMVNVNWSVEDNFGYNGFDQSDKVSAYINGVGNDDIIEVTLTTPDFKNVGKFEFNASLDNANYTLTNNTKTYTIVPMEIEVNWSADDNFVYNGIDQKSNVTAYINGVGNDDIINVTLTAPEFKNVGTFAFVASLDNANYTLTNTSNTYTIVPFGVEVIWSVEDNFGYNGFDQSGKVSAYINGVGSDDIIDVTLTAPDFKNAGKFAFIASLDNGNYTLINTSKSYTIVPLVVEVNWSVEEEFVYNGLDQSGKVSAYINGVGNDGKIDVTLTTNEFIIVGEYVFNASLNNDNYSLINTAKTYFIAPLTVEVSWLDKTSFIYNGFDQSENIYVLTDYELEFIITFNKILKDVGQYQATVTFTNNNYKPSIPNKIYEIIPKLVNANWASFESLTYNGFDQSVMVTAFVDGVGNDGKIDLIVSFANEFKNVGNYLVYASLNNQNYQLENAIKQYVINPANVKILIDNKESTYKEPIVNLTYQLEGYLFGNDNLNVSLFTDATANSNVGNYFINGSASNSNYLIEIIPATYKIIKANQQLNPLSINNFIITYNAITVIPIDGALYSIDGEHYDLNNVFNQLLPLTEYHIFVKLCENDNYRESNIVSIIVMTKADTSEFDTLVNRMIIEDAKDLFNDIKKALSILNQIGREHFDPAMVQKLDEIIEGYNDYLTSIHQEFETALNIGNLVTSHVDIVNIIYQITTVINLMAITLGVLMLRKFKRE